MIGSTNYKIQLNVFSSILLLVPHLLFKFSPQHHVPKYHSYLTKI
jgi:hypothetical protein